MFTSKHYVPVLKWKPAEQQALEKLSSKEKGLISPLIQLVMPTPKPPKKGEREKTQDEQLEEIISSFKTKIPKVPEEILKAWGKTPVFLDFSLIYTPALRIEGLNQIMTIGESLGLFLIPVINLSSDQEIKRVASLLAKKHGHGLCLRLVCADLEDIGKLSKEIMDFLRTSALTEKDIDLLVDLKDTYENKDKYSKFGDASQNIPNLSKWRTFIFASGAFPVDLTDCEVGENYRERLDWNNWLSQIHSKTLKRRPSFADYTIQHPIYRESVRFFAPSASIRYTITDRWLILRGQKGKSAQYLANAQLLSQDQKFSKVFRGANFSFGDAYILEKGKDLKSKKTGNATNWLTAGINHHLALTAHQIANLS